MLKRLMVLVAGVAVAFSLLLTPQSADAAGSYRAEAIVLVNSQSASYSDFQHYIQPYLDNFGIPYDVLDIAQSAVPSDIRDYAVVIVGHRMLDTGNVYLDASEQSFLSSAVFAGTGLVNFDNSLWANGSTPRYQFLQDVFNFGRGGSTSGSGVKITNQGVGANIIDCWDDNHQDPVLATTSNYLDLSEDDGLWTEFYWAPLRSYPAVFAGANEHENHNLPTIRFFDSDLPDGDYTLYANLFTHETGRDMRYYYGYSASDPKAHYVDVLGGSGGSTGFAEYALGNVTISDGTFSLYVSDADLLSGDYPWFGWAWVRLVPVGTPSTHYITADHQVGEVMSTSSMTLAGITLPPTAVTLATTGSQPFLTLATAGSGHAVQWGSYDWMSLSVHGAVYGLDDLVWRSIVWAARKPFVMQALPPLVTMRVDDEMGPFTWIHIANEVGLKPWAGLFIDSVTGADDLSSLTAAGQATAGIHGYSNAPFYFDHGVGELSDASVTANYAAGTEWFSSHNIPISKFVVPHYYEIGANAFSGLKDLGVEFIGTMVKPGDAIGSSSLLGGPYCKYEVGNSYSTLPLYYADFLAVPYHPEFDGQFFNCVTEIRDDTGYEWYPDTNVSATVARGTRQLKRAFDSKVLATLFTHGNYIAAIPSGTWRAELQNIAANIAPYSPQYVTMDYACQYVRAITTSSVSASELNPMTNELRTIFTGKTDIPTTFYLYTNEGNEIVEQSVLVPVFDGSTQVVTNLGPPSGDLTPPVISEQAADHITAASAAISWTTDEPATAQVEYGITSDYGSTTSLDESLSMSHIQTLTGLDPNVTYHYRVLSRDAAGNLAQSPDATFETSDRPTLSINDVSVTEGNSGTVNAVFTVSLSGASEQEVSVAWATSAGTATALTDYVPTSGTLTFTPGATTRTLAVSVAGDTVYEADQTFFVDLSSPVNATVSDAQGLGTILNDDIRPTLSINDVSVTEGNSGTVNAVFTVSLSGASEQEVSVAWATSAGTATALTDYVPTSGTLTFTPGATTRTLAVSVAGDTVYEADQTFFVDLSSPVNATVSDAQGLGTILNDDIRPTLSINDVSVTEGNSGTVNAVFTVSLSGASEQEVSVAWATSAGTATALTDYVPTSGTLTFTPGATTRTLAVSVAGDTVYEADQTFFVDLSSPVNATVSDAQGLGTILNDDIRPTLSINDVSVTEGNSGTVNAVFTVSLSGASEQEVSVAWATSAGTATALTDYVPTSGTLTFTPGATTRTLAVSVAGDTVYEADQTFFVDLSSPVNATVSDAQGLGTILNDDIRPTLSINDVSVTEGNSGTVNAVFTVSLSGASEQEVSVAWATSAGTATASKDYAAASGTLKFPAGTSSRTIAVPVIGDARDETDETFSVILSNAPNATIIKSTGVCTIVDNDAAPSIKIGNAQATEGNTGLKSFNFTLTLSAASDKTITVHYATGNNTARSGSDYVAQSGIITFGPGSTSRTITVFVNGDRVREADETFYVYLSNPVNASFGVSSGVPFATGRIVNDDR